MAAGGRYKRARPVSVDFTRIAQTEDHVVEGLAEGRLGARGVEDYHLIQWVRNHGYISISEILTRLFLDGVLSIRYDKKENVLLFHRVKDHEAPRESFLI
jgi:hypothetical protein